MICKACLKRGKTWTGSDPKCAFAGGHEWSEDNWNCATDGVIRDLVDDPDELKNGITYRYCDDQKYATVDVSGIDFESGHRALTLWVSWYKSRGATDSMWLLPESAPPCRPTEYDLLQIAAYYKNRP